MSKRNGTRGLTRRRPGKRKKRGETAQKMKLQVQFGDAKFFFGGEGRKVGEASGS